MDAPEEVQIIMPDNDQEEKVPEKTVPNFRNLVKESIAENSENTENTEKMPDMRKVVEEKMTQKELSTLIAKRTKERRAKLTDRFVSNLTLHGYSYFHEATGFRKGLWATILGTMGTFFIALTYMSYYSDSYYAQVVEFQSMKVDELDFPTVTVCNYNPVYAPETYKRKDFPIKISKKEFLIFYHQMLSNRGNIYDIKSDDVVEKMIKDLKAQGITSYIDILKLFENNAEEDIHTEVIREVIGGGGGGCSYEMQQCNLSTDFRTVYRNAGQSLCKQFNYYNASNKKARTSRKTGMSGGLKMYWSIEGKQWHYDSLHGLLVEIHHYNAPQHLIDYNNAITLEPGVFTTIEIQQIKTKRLPPPFKPNCGKRPFKMIQPKYPYSNAMCQVDCLLEKTYKVCGCVGDQFQEHLIPDIPICDLKQMPCIFYVSSTNVHEECHECRVECSAVQYKISTSRMAIGNNLMFDVVEKLPNWTKNQKNWKSRQDTESYIKENIVGFRIVFKNLEIEENNYKMAVAWYERISMVGGSIGLLLGFSFITGFELLFFLFDYITTPMFIRTSRKHFGDRKALLRGSVLKSESLN